MFIYWFWALDEKEKSRKKPKNDDNDDDDRCFQHPAKIVLNHEKTELHPEGDSNIKQSIDNYNWKRINYPSKIEHWKIFLKMIQQLLSMFYMLKKREYVLLIFKKFIQIEKNK